MLLNQYLKRTTIKFDSEPLLKKAFIFLMTVFFWHKTAEVNAQTEQIFNNSNFNQLVDNAVCGPVKDITATELMEYKTHYLILDSRKKEEFNISRIPNAVWVGYKNFEPSILAGISKETKMVVYCTLGWRSERIAQKIKKLGFKNVVNLRGSIIEWANHNYPLIDKDSLPTKKVHVYNKKMAKWLKYHMAVY